MKRQSGVLMHISSLPSPYGIGDFGTEAFKFVDFLSKSGQKIWQILPLTIPDSLGSPYASPSAFAGNWLLISPDELVREGLLQKKSLPDDQRITHTKYPKIVLQQKFILEKSYDYFLKHGSADHKKNFNNFTKKHSKWLDDYALFMALKDHFRGKQWFKWPQSIANRDEETIKYWQDKIKKQIAIFKYGQWIFFYQYKKLKQYAHKKEIRIFGDIPFFIIHDSVDVWVNKKIFLLDNENKPLAKSGVPPDYFSKRGQLWGDPQYNWEIMRRNNFHWFVRRLRMAEHFYDDVRLDHFRGYQAVWHVDSKSKSSKNGKWVDVPGDLIFKRVKKEFKSLSIISEDLGYITSDVVKLRKRFHFPGMRVMQFGFGGLHDNFHLPKNFTNDCVAYTGTHDNDTTYGWITKSGKPPQKKFALDYTKVEKKEFAWKLIELGSMSKAGWFIFPMQDALNLNSEARMNKPSTKKNNWQWRMKKNSLSDELAVKIKKLTKSARR
ncbi:4-alpha-glucanotransferase [Patescibacteria group bacterium]|nr:4-alpha-glucanotransferase [Patescibacteria group bacterium]